MKVGMLFLLVASIAVGLEVTCAQRPVVRGKQRPGVCPELPKGAFGICIENCSRDESCPKRMKCCSNGCGHTCQYPLPEKGDSDGKVKDGLDIY